MLSEDVKLKFRGFEPTHDVRSMIDILLQELHLKSPSRSFMKATFTLANGVFEGATLAVVVVERGLGRVPGQRSRRKRELFAGLAHDHGALFGKDIAVGPEHEFQHRVAAVGDRNALRGAHDVLLAVDRDDHSMGVARIHGRSFVVEGWTGFAPAAAASRWRRSAYAGCR